MTLIVSLRIPDGIVLAGDSLATLLMGQGQIDAALSVTCPECNHAHEIQQTLLIPGVPATTFSYTQKIFPFLDKFGVGTFGAGLLAEKSVYFAIRLFEERSQEKKSFTGVTEVAKEIGEEIHNLLTEQLKRENTSVEDFPANQIFLGFQVVGYDDTEPKTVEVLIGKEVRLQPLGNLGCTVSGSREIVQAIWDVYETDPGSQPPYPAFSLQDAIDYAEFLIRTTVAHQRFSQQIPNVGGDIDIALVTPFDGFRWIRQKPLGKILGGNRDDTDSDC